MPRDLVTVVILPEHFFTEIGAHLRDQILLVAAFKQTGDGMEMVAGALNFFSESTLYGRYWGCSQETEFLHFELCYYRGIEFCIDRNLDKFDAGAQGEHKNTTGFCSCNNLFGPLHID